MPYINYHFHVFLPDKIVTKLVNMAMKNTLITKHSFFLDAAYVKYSYTCVLKMCSSDFQDENLNLMG